MVSPSLMKDELVSTEGGNFHTAIGPLVHICDAHVLTTQLTILFPSSLVRSAKFMVVLTFFSCQIYFTSVSITSFPYFSTNLTEFSVWNLVCGFAQTKGQLIAFRFLAGVGGSAPLSVSIPHPKKSPCTRLFQTL